MKDMRLKTIPLLALAFLGINCFKTTEKPPQSGSKSSIYSLSYISITGDTISMESYKGKKILIVNVASKCGFTPQYEELEKLSEQYKDKLTVVGFPANDFLGQEPGTNGQIAEFCRLTYGVTFPMAEKITVTGDGKHPVYQWLTDTEKNGWNRQEPKWNFHKYLIDEKGELIAVFPSNVKPLSPEILNKL